MNLLVLILAIFVVIPSAQSVSLSGHATDESVCDLAPSTSYNLSKNELFVEAGTRDEAEIYTRIALRFITSKCRDGQLLIMHSEFGDPLDDRFFRNVSAQVCSASKVAREATATTEAPHSFQLKCPISRLREASAHLARLERAQSTESMIASGAPIHRQEVTEENQTKKRNCSEKLTFGQAILGLGGGCRD